ncbi:MAG: radical SAM protein [Candidatus Omnitrophica bacterium]|nr:radical SAM protein [Candidatus Omnitrophota bacterium]
MKILFIFKSENFVVPIGLCAISAVARGRGHQVYLCETNSADPFKSIARIKPDMLVYSSSTGEAKHYSRLNSAIKQSFPDIFTVMGGPHPTFYPEMIQDNSFDAVCVGEGDGAFADLLLAVEDKQAVDHIPNIVTRNNLKVFSLRNLVEDLDSLPFPDYSLLYDNTPMGKYPLKSIIASRGCPYNCTYCFNAAWRKLYQGKGRPVRRHSVDYVIDEILFVRKRWPLSFVKFYDDIFAYSADSWLEEFSRKYKEKINLPFFVLTRADLVTEEMVRLLKNAGCHTISMSIESGSYEIRKNLLNRNMTDEQIINAHLICAKHRISTFTNCVIGLPNTTLKNDIESLELSLKSKVTWAEFPIFHPYPGTELGQKSVDLGVYSFDFEKMHTSYQHESLLNCFTKKEKNAQMNLALLGPVVIVFPFLKNLVLKYLIFIKHNPVFTFTYYLTKMYILRKKIYVTKTNFWTSFCIFTRSLRQEWFRHENKKG